MIAPTQFRLPDGLDKAKIEATLAKRYDFLAETPLAQSWRIYDTFDSRLYFNSLMLQWSGDDLQLRSVPHGELLHQQEYSRPPRMAEDLPEGKFGAQLAALIQMRALLELTVVDTWSQTYRILNKNDKTVVRLIYTEVSGDADEDGTPHAAYLTVEPLRGYAKQAGRLSAYLKRRLDVTPSQEDVYFRAMRAAENAPGAYLGRLDVYLKPSIPAGEAAKRILRQLMETMRANEAGVKADIDTEFLHDYRIAARRTRSALSQIRNVFPLDATVHFKREFRELSQVTNELRDLDVHLLAEADYRAMLPEAMQEDITPLFDNLRFRRSGALAQVVTCLESESYARLLDEWEAFLHEPLAGRDARNASVPIIKLARKRMTRQYDSIIKDGTYILDHTEDELLHALRIECKKLRYQMEFFASLFPRKDMSRMLKRLKRLQDNLGDHSDLSIQQEFLLSIAEGLDMDEEGSKRALIATGFLVETLERKRQAVRGDFAGTFRKFASPTVQKRYRKALAKGRKGKA